MAVTKTMSADAFLIEGIVDDPRSLAERKTFSGTLQINGLADKIVAGVLRKVGGTVTGSLQIAGSAQGEGWIPISLTHTTPTDLVVGTTTFVLPSEVYNLDADGFYFIDGATATVDAGFSSISIAFNDTSKKYTPGEAVADGSIVNLNAVVAVFVPENIPNADADWKAMDMTPDSVNALTVMEVNKELSPFKNTGLLFGIDRIFKERNDSMAQRIMQARVFPSNATGDGLVSGVTRDLDLSRKDILRLSTKPGFANTVSEIMIEVDDSYLKIYNKYINSDNNQLELEMDLRADDNIYLSDIMEKINGLSQTVEAVSLVDDPTTVFSRILVKQENWYLISSEFVPQSTAFDLKNKNVKEGSIFFSDKVAFETEVTSALNLSVQGDYYINYATGAVQTITAPSDAITVSYKYTEMPFDLHGADAVVKDLNGRGLRRHYFKQEEQEFYTNSDNKTVDALPTGEMFELVKKLLEVADTRWGS